MLAVVFAVAVALDQAVKFLVDATLPLNGPGIPLLNDVLQLSYVRNQGAVFGMSFGPPVVLLGITLLVTAVLLYLYLSGEFDPGSAVGEIAIVLVLAGAVGNLIDRIRFGEVIDFINMGIGPYRWPTYNVADICITVGVIVLIVSTLLYGGGEPERPSDLPGV